MRNYWEFGCACFFFQFCFVVRLLWFVRGEVPEPHFLDSKVHPMVSSFNRSGKSTTPMVCWYMQCMKTRDAKVIVGRISRSMFFQRTIELSYVRLFWGDYGVLFHHLPIAATNGFLDFRQVVLVQLRSSVINSYVMFAPRWKYIDGGMPSL